MSRASHPVLAVAALGAAFLLVPNAAAHRGGIAGGDCNRGSEAWTRSEQLCVARHSWPRRLLGRLERIVECESRFEADQITEPNGREWHWRPGNGSPAGAAGPLQFLRSTWMRTPWRRHSRLDPNAAYPAAYWLYLHEGHSSFAPWSCARLVQ